MAEVEGQRFENGNNCRIVSYVSPDGLIEADTISITGEYPVGEFGEVWAKNEESHLLAKISSGSGRIAIRQVIDGEVVPTIIDLTPSNAVYIPADTWYGYQSGKGEEMTIDATFVPPFSPDHYKIASEETLRVLAAIHGLVKEELDSSDLTFLVEASPDVDDALGMVYGRLIEEGKDPDTLLQQYGIIEQNKEVK